MAILLFILSIIFYSYAPVGYNMMFCVSNSVLFVCSFLFLIRCGKERILSFNALFSISLFLVTFIAPLFVLPIDYTSLNFAFGDHDINKATCLSTMAYCAYIYGWQLYAKKKRNDGINLSCYTTTRGAIKALNVMCIFVSALYMVMFLLFLKSSDIETNDMQSGALIVMTQAVLVVGILLSTLHTRPCNLRTFIRNNKIPLFCTMVSIATSLYIGDRTYPMFLGLSTFLIYECCVRKVKGFIIVLVVTLCAFIFSVVGQTRKTDSSLRSGGVEAFTDYISETNTDMDVNTKILVYVYDFIPAAECLYLSYEWPEKNNKLYLPGRFLVYAVSPLPYMPTVLSNAFFDREPYELSSAYEVTKNYSSQIRYIEGGLGTHVVGDIYMSTGLIGCILAFILFGYLMSYIKQTSKTNIYSLIAYISMTSYAIYLARDTLYGNYRILAFQLFVVWLIGKYSRPKKSYINK